MPTLILKTPEEEIAELHLTLESAIAAKESYEQHGFVVRVVSGDR